MKQTAFLRVLSSVLKVWYGVTSNSSLLKDSYNEVDFGMCWKYQLVKEYLMVTISMFNICVLTVVPSLPDDLLHNFSFATLQINISNLFTVYIFGYYCRDTEALWTETP